MKPSPRVQGALGALVNDLAECCAWQKELEAEAARAATRRDALTGSVRATIEALPADTRAPWVERLAGLIGAVPPTRPQNRPTPQTRTVLRWLARREKPVFHVDELRAHLTDRGFTPCRSYEPNLMHRWCPRGIVTRVSTGRYRINRDHPEVAGRA